MHILKKIIQNYIKIIVTILVINVVFALFIFGCGTTHLIDGIIYKWPHYRLLILTDVLTAGISIITAAVLPSVTRFISSLRSIEELEEALKLAQDERDKRVEIENNVQILNHQLANEVQRLQNIIATQGWIAQKQMDLQAMKQVITDLRRQYKPSSEK